ncbi:MAG: RNase adapter RapZ [Elusimicrobiota bacterium]
MTTKFFFITGLSGAGKSQALKILEDFGFFSIDNLPVELLPKFADICLQMGGKFRRVALGIDARGGKDSLDSLRIVLEDIRKKGIRHSVLFFSANNENLLQRYSETRRKHPLGKTVIDGIKKERKLMEDILSLSDKEIDTSNLNLGELKEVLARLLDISTSKNILVSVVSFGYKYGMPPDADIVIDVRFLPNPNYINSLRQKTGKDGQVKRFIKKQADTKKFFRKFFQLLDFLLPLYVKEGKSYLTIAVGCTGGRHRSVTVAEATGSYLRHKGYNTKIAHRDIIFSNGCHA